MLYWHLLLIQCTTRLNTWLAVHPPLATSLVNAYILWSLGDQRLQNTLFTKRWQICMCRSQSHLMYYENRMPFYSWTLWQHIQRRSTRKGSSSLSLSSRNSCRNGDFSEAIASIWRTSLLRCNQRTPSRIRLNLAERRCQMRRAQIKMLIKEARWGLRISGQITVYIY